MGSGLGVALRARLVLHDLPGDGNAGGFVPVEGMPRAGVSLVETLAGDVCWGARAPVRIARTDGSPADDRAPRRWPVEEVHRSGHLAVAVENVLLWQAPCKLKHAMRAMAGLLVLMAVGLFVASGLCSPGSDCAYSPGHAFYVASAVSTVSFAPGVIDSMSPTRTTCYDNVVADPATPPPRA